jgi:hypothetical protein
MKRKLLGMALATSLGILATADRAKAQVPQTNPSGQPAFSPYLNLTRPGNPAVNLFGLVRPQMDTNRQLQGLQQQQLQQQGLIAQLGVGGEDEVTTPIYAITGHNTTFFNYSHFFGQAGGNIRPSMPPATPVIRRQ